MPRVDVTGILPCFKEQLSSTSAYLVGRGRDGQEREALHGVDGVHNGAARVPFVCASLCHESYTRAEQNRIDVSWVIQ